METSDLCFRLIEFSSNCILYLPNLLSSTHPTNYHQSTGGRGKPQTLPGIRNINAHVLTACGSAIWPMYAYVAYLPGAWIFFLRFSRCKATTAAATAAAAAAAAAAAPPPPTTTTTTHLDIF